MKLKLGSLIILMSSFFLISCSTGKEHEHSYNESDWKYNEKSHWHECSCGEKDEIKNHVWDSGIVVKEATETEEGEKVYTCIICGTKKKVILDKVTPSHTHSYPTDWVTDESSHWHECSCGEKDEVKNHVWDSGKVVKEATETEEGEMVYTCTICGREKTVIIDKEGQITNEGEYEDGDDWNPPHK